MLYLTPEKCVENPAQNLRMLSNPFRQLSDKCVGNLSQKLRKPQNHLRKVSKGFWLPHKFHCYSWYCCYICVRGGWWVIALFLLLLLLLMLLLLLLFFRTYICRYVVLMMVALMFCILAGVTLACSFAVGTVTLRQTPPGIRRNAFSSDLSYSSGFATCIERNICWAYV